MSADPFLPSLDLVRRCQTIIGECTAVRVGIVAARPGNPLGAAVRRFDSAIATRAPPFGEHHFNTAFGFTDENLDEAGAVADWYAEAGVAGAFEIVPGPPTGKLMEMLHGRGFRQKRFHGAFAGPPELPQLTAPGVTVRRLEDATDLEAFSEAYHVGWNQTGFRVPVAPWLTAPGWSLYLGLCDGEPAGAAILCVTGGDAYLADGAVMPAFRNRGVHRALLDARCADAAAAGAQAIFSGADYLSGSSRNMQRKGLGLLFTKAIWVRSVST
jgi:GNAT superfamily N-acetyltransferase